MSPPPVQQVWYVCKFPGCKWERKEPPQRTGFPEALRDLALEYDTHEANEHPDSPYSGLTTTQRPISAPD